MRSVSAVAGDRLESRRAPDPHGIGRPICRAVLPSKEDRRTASPAFASGPAKRDLRDRAAPSMRGPRAERSDVWRHPTGTRRDSRGTTALRAQGGVAAPRIRCHRPIDRPAKPSRCPGHPGKAPGLRSGPSRPGVGPEGHAGQARTLWSMSASLPDANPTAVARLGKCPSAHWTARSDLGGAMPRGDGSSRSEPRSRLSPEGFVRAVAPFLHRSLTGI